MASRPNVISYGLSGRANSTNTGLVLNMTTAASASKTPLRAPAAGSEPSTGCAIPYFMLAAIMNEPKTIETMMIREIAREQGHPPVAARGLLSGHRISSFERKNLYKYSRSCHSLSNNARFMY